MRNLFLFIFSVFFAVSAWATTPPGLYDNNNLPPATNAVNPNQQKKKVRDPNEPAIPRAIIENRDEKRLIKDPNAPLFDKSNVKGADDSLIPNIDIDFNKIMDSISGVMDITDKDGKDGKKDGENTTGVIPPYVPAMPIISNVPLTDDKNDSKTAGLESVKIKEFKIPNTLGNKNMTEAEFLSELLSNLPKLEPRDKNLEKLKAEEELKIKQEEFEQAKRKKIEDEKKAVLEQQQKEIDAETEKKLVIAKSVEQKEKRKTKREKLIDKIYAMSIAGFNLGMTPEQAIEYVKDTDFKIEFIKKEIPAFLTWNYEKKCLKERNYSSNLMEKCVAEQAKAENVEYISEITMKDETRAETIKLLFSTSFSSNKLYRVEYKTFGDTSLGNSSKADYIREQRKLDFLRRVRKRYGNPDDLRNMTWGSRKDAVTLQAFVTSINMDGNIIMEDLRTVEADINAIRRAAVKVPRDDNFSF